MKYLKGKIAAVLTAAAIGFTSMPVTAFAQTEFIQDSVSIDYKATVSKPTYTIKGTPGVRKIKLKSATSGATIYYTTDGSVPTTSSKKYTGLITIKKNTKIRAIAVKNGSKSAVMTKTVKVATLKGDATGNGIVDEADYTRYKNYRAGKTSYICKDNCDMDGSGGLSAKDLKLLKSYIEGDLEDDEEENIVSSSIDKPEITVYKAYGGKRFQIECDTAGATIYYTTDGTEPNKNDTKYVGKFLVDKDTTVKAVAYKGGKYSKVKTRSVTVEQCLAPFADKPTDKEYSESVKIVLDCKTDKSRILYTTNGSDPIKYGTIYTKPIELTENTVLKIAAQSKGYSDSKVVTYEYRVKSSKYTISGRVWDDTSVNTTSDGKYQAAEAGVNGIKVHLLNTTTNKYDETVVTSTINGVAGSYILTQAKGDTKYKVVFQFNGQKYRAYPTVIAGGNQAVSSAFPQITIKSGGAYTAAGVLLIAVNSYNNAINSGFFNETYATTNTVFTSTASGVDLALQSNVFGNTSLEFSSSKVTSAEDGQTVNLVNNQKIFANDVLTYTLRVKNNSATQTLKSAEIMIYVDTETAIQSIKIPGGATATYSYQGTDAAKGLAKYLVSCGELAPNKVYEFTVTTKVIPNVGNGKNITCFAEIFTYTYKDSCYDKSSIPGNFSGTVREPDEAATPVALGYESLTDSQKISWASGNDFKTPIIKGTSRVFTFNIANGVNRSDYNVYISDPSVVSYITSCTPTNTGTQCILVLTGLKAGSTNIVISLARDSSKLIDATVSVKDLEAAQ